MAIVRFKGYGEIEVPVGTSILEAAQKLDAPEGYACGGVCACSTCHVYVQKGKELLEERCGIEGAGVILVNECLKVLHEAGPGRIAGHPDRAAARPDR